MFNPMRSFFLLVSKFLSKISLIDAHRGERISELTWPRTLTMFARFSKRTADVAMIGLAVGTNAVAGIGFATVYWTLAVGFPAGIVGGTIGKVSQAFGGNNRREIDLTFKQSVLLGVVVAIPLMSVFVTNSEYLLSIFTSETDIINYGAVYLQILGFGLIFITVNLIGSRTLAGADDTWLTMVIRTTGAVVNIILNTVFIFGLGMGVAGAALGTVLAEGLVTVLFLIGFVYGRLPFVGEFPVKISITRPFVNGRIIKELIQMSLPLIVRRLAESAARFPLFAILAVFGPSVVAAFEIARRVRNQLNAAGRGFSMSGSSLVGQELGKDDETGATNFGKDVIRFSAAVYILLAALVLVFAPEIAVLFSNDPSNIEQIVPFVRIAAISAIGLGMFESYTGILKAAGDNNWTLYGNFAGQYIFLVPLVYIGSVTPLGIILVYAALIAETWSSVIISAYRYYSGQWKIVSRSYRTSGSATND